MLENSEIENPNAIETIICKAFESIKCVPMTEDIANILINLLCAPKINFDDDKPFLVAVMEKRVEFNHTFKINDNKLYLFLAILTKSPGTAIMYLWYLQYWCFNNNVKELNIDIFCENIFPFGMPPTDELQKIWESQKVLKDRYNLGSDNLVDYVSAGGSIQFTEKDS